VALPSELKKHYILLNISNFSLHRTSQNRVFSLATVRRTLLLTRAVISEQPLKNTAAVLLLITNRQHNGVVPALNNQLLWFISYHTIRYRGRGLQYQNFPSRFVQRVGDMVQQSEQNLKTAQTSGTYNLPNILDPRNHYQCTTHLLYPITSNPARLIKIHKLLLLWYLEENLHFKKDLMLFPGENESTLNEPIWPFVLKIVTILKWRVKMFVTVKTTNTANTETNQTLCCQRISKTT